MGHQTVLDTRMVNKEKRDNENIQHENTGDGDVRKDETVRIKQKVAEVGTQRKRKVVKVIGDEFQDRKDVGKASGPTKIEAEKRSKKAKKVKLSFDDAEG